MNKSRVAISTFIVLILMGCVDKVTDSKKLSKIKQPSLSDFYHFVGKHKLYIAKVEGFSNDSIYFKYIRNDIGSKKMGEYNYGEFKLNRKPMSFVKVAMNDIIESPFKPFENEIQSGKILLPGLNENMPLMLKNVYRVDTNDINIAIIDTDVEYQILTEFENFKSSNLNQQLTMLDSTSSEYLSDILKNSSEQDISKFKQYLLNSDYSVADYEISMFTRFLFLNQGNYKRQNKKELLKEFLPFYAKFSSSIFSYLYSVEDLELKSVKLTGTNTAIANFSATTNLLSHGRFSKSYAQIDFEIKYILENELWKMNLQSTYNFLIDQVKIITLQEPRNPSPSYKEGKGELQYRNLVRTKIENVVPGLIIDNQLKF